MAKQRVGFADIEQAAFLFASGWFRKSLGDVFGAIADPVFANPYGHSAWMLLWGLYAFSFQIYLDFSGYTDMARGVARLFGVDLMENFRSPYFARNVQDFWRRWHISLSTWLRDYLYIPLGGNRKGDLGTGRNLLVTMVIGGIWHGAAWNFAVWGLMHGMFLLLRRAAARLRPNRPARSTRVGDALRIALTFHLIVLTWLVFRAQPVGDIGALSVAVDYLIAMSGLASEPFARPPVAFWLLAPVVALDVFTQWAGGAWWSRRLQWAVRGVVTAGLALLGYVLGSGGSRAFIYFQF
jgi:D-alanyl-lipoteichoic acid acyltransferase DltB (MBOAT superfamily)